MTTNQNSLLVEQERSSGVIAVESLPLLVTMECTSICNLRCVMCPHAVGDVVRPKHLPLDTMDAMAGPLAAAEAVQLHGIGEPLASPSFWRAIEGDYLDPDCRVSINTNLTLLDEKRIGRLVALKGQLLVNVSLDAATSETYRRIRGFEFDEVLANIRRLIAARGDRPYPKVHINMTLMRENIEEVVRFVELAKDLGCDGVEMWHLNRYDEGHMARYVIAKEDWTFDYPKQGLWNYPALSNACVKAAITRAGELDLPIHTDVNKVFIYEAEPSGEAAAPAEPTASEAEQVGPSQPTVKDCGYPWQWALVEADGSVKPCCYVGKSVGNVNEEDFRSIWNGNAMRQLREDVIADRINPVCSGAACKYVQGSLAAQPAPSSPDEPPQAACVSEEAVQAPAPPSRNLLVRCLRRAKRFLRERR